MQIKSSKKILLLELLQELSPDSSKNRLREWVKQGRVSINDQVAKHPNQVVEMGEQVHVSSKPKFLEEGIKILYEDEDLIVIDKPAGLLSVATDLEKNKHAHALLKRRFHNRRVYPIHRLDQETSGLLVFAYTKKARENLKDQLEKRTMSRHYTALVHGHPGDGTWKCLLAENPVMRVHVSSHGKEAITHFKTLEKKGKHSLIQLKLETGRKHQIRVQAAHYDFPIVGDSKYGLEEDAGRPMQLRAIALYFTHPRTKKLLRFGQHTP